MSTILFRRHASLGALLALTVAAIAPGPARAAIAPPTPTPPQPAAGATSSTGIGPARAVSRAALGPARSRGGATLAFWAGEAVPGTDWDVPESYWNLRSTRLYTPQLWEVLRRERIPLYLNLRYRRDFGPVPPGMPQRYDGLRLIRAANRHDVPVWGWILTPFTDGYWAWEGAAAQNFDALKAVVRWTREKRLRMRGFVLDFESPVGRTLEASAATLGANAGLGLPPVLGQAIDPAAQCRAWRGYAQIAAWARQHGIRLAATPSTTALDDLADGGIALQDAAQYVVPSAPWHALFFQAYRSVYDYYLGSDPGHGIVSSYLNSARRAYGAGGQVSLGSAGRGPYQRLQALVDDVRLAATLGAREVPIYSLERTLRAYGGPPSVAKLARAARHPFFGAGATRATAPTDRARAVRAAIRRVDRAATAATPAVTATDGASLSANSWPRGCGA